ncbi:MAG: EAL domain-containing protein [Gammaproteobacteria bacterium]|nr:EAL domain-containing protein [Gammaproteobacteria bacterium]
MRNTTNKPLVSHLLAKLITGIVLINVLVFAIASTFFPPSEHAFIFYFITSMTLTLFLVKEHLKHFTELQANILKITQGNLSTPIQTNSTIPEFVAAASNIERIRLTLIKHSGHMEHRALHDDLTGLANTDLLNDRINRAVSQSRRENNSFSLVMLSLRKTSIGKEHVDYKPSNAILRKVADGLLECIRDTDTLARISDSEFCIIYRGIRLTQSRRLANNILEKAQDALNHEEQTLQAKPNIGISLYPDHGDSSQLLLERANVALEYGAQKHTPIIAYKPHMDQNDKEQLLLTFDIKQCLKKNQLFAVFQPKIDLKAGMPCGCEILLRWSHPELGLITPEKFIHIAERENFISQITEWLIKHHLAQLREIISRHPDFTFSINISPNNLLDEALLGNIESIIDNACFPVENLVFEVSESAVTKNTVRAKKALRRFERGGIIVSIDNFGTGQSSLSYLNKLPIKELKIDRSLIADLTKGTECLPIVSSAIAQCHELDMTIVAEGVENKETLDLLNSMGCDKAQGYYLSKPLSFENLCKWLQEEIPQNIHA